MWKIKQIFDGEYGCEECSHNAGPQMLVVLNDEFGKEKSIKVADKELIEKNLNEGDAWPYDFWGWQKASARAVSKEFPGIDTPFDLYDALSEIWCEYTCAPRMRENWSKANKTLGQCSITAFLCQDIFGGEVYGILRSGGNYHCYNVVGEAAFDLTSEQFGSEVLNYEENPKQFREIHFAKEEKRLRYEYLKDELKKYCDINRRKV